MSISENVRLYLLGLPTEGVPGNADSTFLGLITFKATYVVPDAFTSSCFVRFYAGLLPLVAPPSCPSCQPVHFCPLPTA